MQVPVVATITESPQFFPFAPFHQGAFIVHDIAFDHFFTLISPGSVVRAAAVTGVSTGRAIVSYSAHYLYKLARDTARTIHTLFMALYGLFLAVDILHRMCTRFIHYFIQDNAFDQKILNLQKEMKDKTGSTLLAECSRVITYQIVSMLKEQIFHAPEIDPAIGPKWLEKLVVQANQPSHSLAGKVICSLLQKNEMLFSKVIECNLLKLFSTAIDHLLHLQSENSFAFLDLIQKCLDKVPAHFLECTGRDHAEVLGEAVQEGHPEASKEIKKCYYKALISALLPIVIPVGAKDLELPVSKTIASYLAPWIFKGFQDEVLPMALKDLFTLAEQPDAKVALLHEALEGMHKFVDLEPAHAESTTVASSYLDKEALNNALLECMLTFFDYADPTFVPWTFKTLTFAPKLVAKGAAVGLSEHFGPLTLLDVLHLAFEKLLPEINPGGTWHEHNGEKVFKTAPFKLEKTKEDVEARRAFHRVQAQKKKEEIDRLVKEIGKDPKGLRVAVQRRIYTDGPKEPQEETSQKSSARKVVDWAVGKLLDGSFYMGDVSNRIQNLNKAIIQKMNQPEHELLLFDIVQTVAIVLNPNALFPEMRQWRYKKQPLLPT